MAKPTDEQRHSAREIVNRLFQVDKWLAQPVSERANALPSGLCVHDVELHAAQFQAETDLLDAWDPDGFPAMALDDEHVVPVSLPVALPYLFGPSPEVWSVAPGRQRRLFLHRYLAFLGPDVERVLNQLYELTDLIRLPRRDAERAFVDRASESLSHRVAMVEGGDEDRPDTAATIKIPPTVGAPAAKVAGCRFTVSTNTSGLRVFWSGAYYITRHYFGGPTTPALGTLQSGTYIFGVDGGAYTSVQWDKAAVCTLPGQPRVNLNY